MTLYKHVPHPHIEKRREQGPAKVADQHPRGTAAQRFNSRLALAITAYVGSMWCAYVFALLALLSLPAVLSQAFHVKWFPGWLVAAGLIALVAWIAQTFLQLVLLSVIMVGQNVQQAAADARSEQTYRDAEAILAEVLKIQEHLTAQDQVLTRPKAGKGSG